MRNSQSPFGRDEGIFLYRVAGVVAAQFTQRDVALGQETLLNSAVAESMQSVEGGVVAHGANTVFEPPVELISQNGTELTFVIRKAKDRGGTEALILAVNVNESEDGANRANQGILGSGQGDLVDPLSKLVVLRLVNLYEDTGVHVVVQRRDVTPTQDHLEIHRLGSLRNQVRAAKHGQVIEDAERFVDGKCVMVQKRGVWRNLCEEEPFQDRGGNREGLFGLVLGQTPDPPEDEV